MSQERRISLLLEHLHKNRVLLVLDNLEGLLTLRHLVRVVIDFWAFWLVFAVPSDWHEVV